MTMPFGGPGIVPSSRGMPSSAFCLSAGQAFIVPSGSWGIGTGPYAALERFDPVTGCWRIAGTNAESMSYVISDGNNYRICNRTGCPVGALLTNAGSGYLTAPTVTASAGASIWQAVLGPVVASTVTVLSGGSGYLYPPQAQISSPSFPGIQATATTAITGGAVTSVTVTNQGGGYTAVPTISFVNDSRDTMGGGANAVLSLTGQQTVAGVLCIDHGTPQTTVPTLAFAGGGGTAAAATVVMDFTLTGYSVGAGGAGFANSLQVYGVPTPTAGSPAYTNPQTQTGLVMMRQGNIVGAQSGGAVTATGAIVTDGGHYETIPALVYVTNSIPTTAATLTATVGGLTAHVLMLAI